MIEYIFFHPKPKELFCEFLEQKNVGYQGQTDLTDVEGYLVLIADDIEDVLNDDIEEKYDELLNLDQELFVEDPADLIDQAGLSVTLKNGDTTLASIKPDVLNRMLTVVSRDELSDFIDAIASAVEDPDQRPLCKR